MTRKTLGQQIRVQVLARDKYQCLMCGRDRNEVPLEVDHIKPVANGGTDELDNLATLCRDCNRGKSAYRFSDYRNMDVVTNDLTEKFVFLTDLPTGDAHRFHLYLYYKNGVHPGGTDDKFHHTWKINGTEYDTSSNKPALISRKQKEEELKFLAEIKRQLVLEGKCLVVNEEGICKTEGK